MMLGDIDLSKKPIKPKIFLAKPDRTIIGKLTEAYGINHQLKLGSLNSITFNLPYEIDVNHRLTRNHNIDNVRERFTLKVELGSNVEWYVINRYEDSMDDSEDSKAVYAMSLGYELADKMIRDLEVVSYNATKILTEALKETIWNVDYVDADFDLVFRSFSVGTKTVLDFVFEIATTFNAVVEWDTENRTISLRKPDLVGTDKGLKFSYGHYLKSLSYDSTSDEMTTRLKVFGADGLSIHRLNIIGQNYIEDFSYFLYPFERDTNKNVIQSSYYMTDSLCQAILDYNALLQTKQGEFDDLLEEKEGHETTLTTKNNEIRVLTDKEDIILNLYDVEKADENMQEYDFQYTGSSITRVMALKSINKYVVMVRVSDTVNMTVTLNGSTLPLTANTWHVSKVENRTANSIQLSGTANNVKVEAYVIRIEDEEFSTANNQTILIEKYNLKNKQEQITAKQAEIDAVKADIKSVDDRTTVLRNEISVENNFTPEQIIERNQYIIEKEWNDPNYISDVDLFNDAKVKFEEVRTPQAVIKIDVVNFLKIQSEQANWEKILMGDIVTIHYEKFNTYVKAKIIDAEFAHDDDNVNLTIANIKDLRTNQEKLMQYLYNSINTSTIVDMNRFKWNGYEQNLGDIDKIINNFWNKAKQEIDMAVNETVIFDKRGITIYDDQDPNKFLRATHGVLGITDDGGKTYKSAITSTGLVGERIYGKIITGERVIIGDPDGILEILGNKGVITDRTGREVMWFGMYQENPDKFGLKLENDRNQVIVDRDDGFKINKKNGLNWDTIAWLDTNGVFHAEGLEVKNIKMTDNDNMIVIDARTGTINLTKMNGWLANNISLSTTDGIVVTRGDGVVKTKLNATDGISISRLEGGNWTKKFWVDTDGILHAEDLVAKRLILTDGNDQIMIDAKNKLLDLTNFNLIIGSIKAENIDTKMLTTEDGYILDLTVNRVKTLGDDTQNEVFFIDIKDNKARWVKGTKQGAGTQKTNSLGQPLYWLDADRSGLTNKNTGLPALMYSYSEVEKLLITYKTTASDNYAPFMVWGTGSGTGDNSKGFILKDTKEFKFSYVSEFGSERYLLMSDDKMEIKAGFDTPLNIISNQIKMQNDLGNTGFEILADGTIKLSHSSGSYILLGSDVKIVSAGDILLN